MGYPTKKHSFNNYNSNETNNSNSNNSHHLFWLLCASHPVVFLYIEFYCILF